MPFGFSPPMVPIVGSRVVGIDIAPFDSAVGGDHAVLDLAAFESGPGEQAAVTIQSELPMTI